MQIILGLALAAAVFVILKKWGALSPEGRKNAVWKAVLVVGGALLVFMVLTGRVHVLTAAVAALIPLLRKIPALLRLVPMARRMAGEEPGEQGTGGSSGPRQAPPGRTGSSMSRQEACDLLGLRPDCTREEVVAAHRRLMLKVHPDRGGSDYLAAKLNEARDVLIDKRAA
ncbi:MAG TPA: DnaJ domain-containing protein [Marinobacter sp.]|nr:DnaJ domain-containing protein [Marinobacter sp.]